MRGILDFSKRCLLSFLTREFVMRVTFNRAMINVDKKRRDVVLYVNMNTFYHYLATGYVVGSDIFFIEI